MEVLGEMQEQDLSFITNDEAAHYVAEKIDSELDRVDFCEEYTMTDPEICAILHHLLEFNYHFRVSPGLLL